MPTYYLTLFELKQYYCPKHLSVSEWKMQSVGTNILLNTDHHIYILDQEYHYKHKPFDIKDQPI